MSKRRSIYDDLPDFFEWVVQAIEFLPMNEGATRILTVLIAMQKEHNDERATPDLQGDRTAHKGTS
jgi:hypothetical protein